MLRRLLPTIALILACDGGGGGNGGNGGSGGLDPSSCEQEPSQGMSEACCLDHGIDACGANLFCAAFDGRSQPTCYGERSRLDGEECGEDRHCASGSCNTEEGACRSLPGTSCDPAIGCAPDLAGEAHVCVADGATCRRMGDGSIGSVCGSDADCDSGLCTDDACSTPGAECGGGGDGSGPCAVDPESEECVGCRLHSGQCRAECGNQYGDFVYCGIEAGCSDGEVLDTVCAAEHCDEELCELEKCSAHACFASDCY